MSGLIERLRGMSEKDRMRACYEAADEIERLRAALKQISESDGHSWMYRRIAREALNETKTEQAQMLPPNPRG